MGGGRVAPPPTGSLGPVQPQRRRGNQTQNRLVYLFCFVFVSVLNEAVVSCLCAILIKRGCFASVIFSLSVTNYFNLLVIIPQNETFKWFHFVLAGKKKRKSVFFSLCFLLVLIKINWFCRLYI